MPRRGGHSGANVVVRGVQSIIGCLSASRSGGRGCRMPVTRRRNRRARALLFSSVRPVPLSLSRGGEHKLSATNYFLSNAFGREKSWEKIYNREKKYLFIRNSFSFFWFKLFFFPYLPARPTYNRIIIYMHLRGGIVYNIISQSATSKRTVYEAVGNSLARTNSHRDRTRPPKGFVAGETARGRRFTFPYLRTRDASIFYRSTRVVKNK